LSRVPGLAAAAFALATKSSNQRRYSLSYPQSLTRRLQVRSSVRTTWGYAYLADVLTAKARGDPVPTLT
jgi:hypothetical protein